MKRVIENVIGVGIVGILLFALLTVAKSVEVFANFIF